ncbi:TolB family protein [Aurantiacibacter sp. MUD61]|uniref:TolB family protein n=1 Tax=Aurantiacibacter sp. MUD61 TaxID=3009083 RepID=UPI0022F0DE31|nr:hypothetical protein [Aurantiacibacter sp. MUD61]
MVSPYLALLFALSCAGCSAAASDEEEGASAQPATDTAVATPLGARRLAPEALGQDGRITFSPGFSPDGQTMYFTRADCELIWECPQLLYRSQRTASGWSPAERVQLPQAEARAEWPSVSPDGSTLYFSWAPDRPRHAGENVYEDFDLFALSLSDAGAEPVALDNPDISRIRGGRIRQTRFVNNETAPVLTRGGDLYFWSERLDGVGLRDIYVARGNGSGGFAAPIPVPGDINTAGENDGSWVTADGRVMLLSTDVVEGEGGADIFVSVLCEGEWSAPRNLGPEINTPDAEFAARITPDGESVVFTSSRPTEAGGESGLYQVWTMPVAEIPVLREVLGEARAN